MTSDKSQRERRPKRRHLVLSEFIEVCVEEDTLLDEDGGSQDLCHAKLQLTSLRRFHALIRAKAHVATRGG